MMYFVVVAMNVQISLECQYIYSVGQPNGMYHCS